MVKKSNSGTLEESVNGGACRPGRLAGKRVTLCVTGSIAAYKSAELVRCFVKEGASVRVAMTPRAREFITPLTLETLSGNPVTTELFDLEEGSAMGHISLADETDLVVVAPASAETIAKAAAGQADNIVTAILLTSRAPRLFVPAMNVNMWENPLTARNVAILKEHGAYFLDPEYGDLACGWVGVGRFPEVDAVLAQVLLHIEEEEKGPQDLKGVRVIVTAGPTREYLDPIRFLTNGSSGKMGYAIAHAALKRGAEVTLISGPTALRPPSGVLFVPVETGEEMRRALHEQLESENSPTVREVLVFMVAAVMDYRAAEISSSKLKHDKASRVELGLVPNPDILRELGAERAALEERLQRRVTLVGFCAETGGEEELLATAREKFLRKGVQLLVANLAQEGFERDTNRVWVLSDSGLIAEIGPMMKDKVAREIVAVAARSVAATRDGCSAGPAPRQQECPSREQSQSILGELDLCLR